MVILFSAPPRPKGVIMWSLISGLLVKFLTAFGIYQAGKNKQIQENLEEENEVLKRQRDNDIHTVDDAIKQLSKRDK